jgi:peroxiredoxin
MNLIVLGIVVPWLLMGLGCWLGFQLVRQNGRILLRLEAIEEYLDRLDTSDEPVEDADKQNGHRPLRGRRTLADSRLQRDGLAKGTPAPDFRLPRVEGGDLSLSDYRGMKVLLVFSDPHCGPCDALAPDLEKAHGRNIDVQVLMVSRGEVGANRDKARQYKLTFPIVLQRKWEISKLYAMFATPIGYLIDEEGNTAAEVAVGAEGILALLPGATPEAGQKEVATVS